MAPSLTYVICSGPRSGSTLLAKSLEATGLAGRPAEYFDPHAKNERFWVDRLGIASDAEYVDKVIKAATTPNGICGLKLLWHQVDIFEKKIAASQVADRPIRSHPLALEAMRPRFGETRYIWLRRRNSVAQAISYYRATESGVWLVVRNRKRPKPLPIEFNPKEIRRLIALCAEFDAAWEDFFTRNGVEPLSLFFETFVEDYTASIRSVLGFLGLAKDAAATIEPPIEQVSDEESLRWEGWLAANDVA